MDKKTRAEKKIEDCDRRIDVDWQTKARHLMKTEGVDWYTACSILGKRSAMVKKKKAREEAKKKGQLELPFNV